MKGYFKTSEEAQSLIQALDSLMIAEDKVISSLVEAYGEEDGIAQYDNSDAAVHIGRAKEAVRKQIGFAIERSLSLSRDEARPATI